MFPQDFSNITLPMIAYGIAFILFGDLCPLGIYAFWVR